MSITSKIYKGDDKIARLYKGDKKVLFMTRGNKVIYADWGPFTFNATGVIQTLVLPKLIKKIHVDCVASKGWTYTFDASHIGVGGNGGRVQCDLAVSGGETLYIMVGAIPTSSSATYNASDIRIGGTGYANRVIVAGGGGGGTAGYRHNANGGAGGGTQGSGTTYTASGYGTGAGGGTQSAGGVGAHNTTYGTLNAGAGQFGLGGTSAVGGNIGTQAGQAGSGGSGYYGGGGGIAFGVFFSGSQQGSWGAGGGGGSSYTNANCSNVVHTKGYRNGAGYVTISFVE